jgi:hypothetical protein
VNPATLNIDTELKRKFGAGVDDGGSGGGRGGGGKPRARGNRLLLRSMFANVRDDWPPPPPFVAGGLRSTKGEASGVPALLTGGAAQLVAFEYSAEGARAEAVFRALQASGDLESMVAFLAEHPGHTGALLQLAVVCLRTGHKDRGADLLRRCLFAYEAGCAEKGRLLEGQLHLDYGCPANAPLFQALFHQMRCAGMVGCETTALEVGKVLLSLSPGRDPMGALLHLDFYALMARNFAAATAIANLDTVLAAAASSSSEEAEGETEGPPIGAARPELRVRDLPSMRLSAALAAYESRRDESDDQSGANALLTTALASFPALLQPLLASCGVDGASRSAAFDWPTVLLSDHFGSQRHHRLLSHLAAVYAARCGPLFKRDDLLRWLYRHALPLAAANAARPHPLAARANALFGAASPAMRYLEIPLSEFGDAYEQLPADLNVLDPALLAPQAQARLADHARFQRRAHRQGGGGGGGGGGGEWGGGEDEDELEEQLAAALATGEPLDPNSPLVQLFWQSALPWNRVQSAADGGAPRAADARGVD